MAHLQTTLQELGQALFECQHLWQPEPFLQEQSPWRNSEPILDQHLMALSNEEVTQLLSDSERCKEWLATIIPDTMKRLDIWQPIYKNMPQTFEQPNIANGIPGRKWQQINYFSQLLDNLPPCMSNVDWCSGKGYLATTLAWHHAVVFSHCLEIDKQLCKDGRDRAYELEVDIDFHCCNVLEPIENTILTLGERHTALHACGGLHRSMLKQTASNAEQIILSPCCFHLFSKDSDNRLSTAASSLAIPFDKATLRIPLLETVTGGERAGRLRKTEIQWRRAYESWRRTKTHDQQYRPLASAPKSLFNQTATQFFSWAAEQHGLHWNSTEDITPFLEKGQKQFELSERLEIVRHGIKRYLEYLIVLDLGCFLEEKGFDVDIVEFCPKHITPRNLAIVAKR